MMCLRSDCRVSDGVVVIGLARNGYADWRHQSVPRGWVFGLNGCRVCAGRRCVACGGMCSIRSTAMENAHHVRKIYADLSKVGR